MNLLLSTLIACAFLGSNESSEMVQNSTSPDGQFRLFVKSMNDGHSYLVKTKDGHSFSEDFRSDFGMLRSATLCCSLTSVLWRPDSAYFVLDEGHDRHHQGFYIATKTSTGFKALEFDRGKIWASAKIEAAFLGVFFKAWLPHNRIELIIRSRDGASETSQPVDFILDLTNGLKVLSWKVLEPEKGYGR